MEKYAAYAGALILAAVFVLAPPSALANSIKCPTDSTPPPGSTVNGGLEVDGACVVRNITVHGGITIDPGAGLGFEGGTVDNGIVLGRGGELDVDFELSSSSPTGTSSTINGGIILNGPVDFDIWNSEINGGFAVNGFTGGGSGFSPTMCANDVRGGVIVGNVTAPSGLYIGDPDDPTGCRGNSIRGIVSVSNSSGGSGASDLELENNKVRGSVLLRASQIQVNGNTITGSLSCTNGATIRPPGSGEAAGNKVGGSNHC